MGRREVEREGGTIGPDGLSSPADSARAKDRWREGGREEEGEGGRRKKDL